MNSDYVSSFFQLPKSHSFSYFGVHAFVKVKVIKEKEKPDLSEKTEQQQCKYYLRSGGCKLGKACRYNHSRGKTVLPPPPPLDFNFLGLPIRPGERECPYYMRTGSCKFGPNCRFHHPDPTAVGGPDTTPASVSLHPSGASQPASTSWSSPSNGTVPFVDAATPNGPMMLPPQRVHPNPEWNGYQAPAYAPERSLLPPSLALNNPTNRTEVFMHNQQHMLDEFPERPGQPECSYFMKTGDCKYRSACKFNHPKIKLSRNDLRWEDRPPYASGASVEKSGYGIFPRLYVESLSSCLLTAR
ncbi:zinc finger CCCH domain-containing protein 43-like [Telopea speciosissima]|uniref:zinc finger CCCH domain-containing protein 43-like n=1 Tax=Telopea speciosissima TaxID=54955 RepID=UPI001CC61B5D|nr:zinc finger CCCH domain-containing protein 43-like [Telopea speciosissima]